MYSSFLLFSHLFKAVSPPLLSFFISAFLLNLFPLPFLPINSSFLLFIHIFKTVCPPFSSVYFLLFISLFLFPHFFFPLFIFNSAFHSLLLLLPFHIHSSSTSPSHYLSPLPPLRYPLFTQSRLWSTTTQRLRVHDITGVRLDVRESHMVGKKSGKGRWMLNCHTLKST